MSKCFGDYAIAGTDEVTRKHDQYNRPWNCEEAVTRQEALWKSTLWQPPRLLENKISWAALK